MLGRRLARCMMHLQQFNYNFEYKFESSRMNADMLSRIPGYDAAQVYGIQGVLGGVDVCTKQQEDPEIATVVKALQKGGRMTS